MKRKRESLGLALAAVFAMSAVGASAASAAEFHAESTGFVTGEHSTGHVIATNAGTMTCSVEHFEGVIDSTTDDEWRVHPTYETCRTYGFIGVPVDTIGCSFVFTGTASPPPIDTDINCSAGSQIQITSPGCTTTIGAQSNLKATTITNQGSGSSGHITVHINIAGITYNECGTVRTNGTYKGSTTMFGSDFGGGENGIWYT